MFMCVCLCICISVYVTELEDMDDLEKNVCRNSNLQKHVIVFITSADDLVPACALVYIDVCMIRDI